MSTHRRLSYGQLKTVWIRNGGPRATAPMGAAIAMAESGGLVDAVHVNADGSIDRGPWQINSVHGDLSTTDLDRNAKAAIKLSSGGLNWQPWTTFRNGAYKQYLSGAKTAPAAASTSSSTSASTSSSDGGQLFGASKQSQVKYAAVWAGVLGAGVVIASIGVNRIMGGAPARAGKTLAKSKIAKAAVAA